MTTGHATAAPHHGQQGDVAESNWNVVATTQASEFSRAKQLLERFGEVETTDFFNVLVLKVDDVQKFLEAYLERARIDPRLAKCVSRIRPMARIFRFAGADDFRIKVRREVGTLISELEGGAFHVRMNRRGMKGELSGQAEEQSLDGHLLAELVRRGAPGRIDFDDPDAVIDIETLGDIAGVALWTRDDLKKYPFLRID